MSANLLVRMDLVDLVRLVEHRDRATAERQVGQIFASNAASSDSAYFDRWLGRYLKHDAGLTHVATTSDGTVVGYLVASHDDPARAARFADVPYFRELASITARYPAHLHINVDARFRGGGIGARLIDCCVADVCAAGLPGLHVVTGRGVRNVGFYARNGFVEAGAASYLDRPVVMLTRDA